MVSSVHKERGGGSTLPVSKNRTDTTIDDRGARTGDREGENEGMGDRKTETRVHGAENTKRYLSSRPPSDPRHQQNFFFAASLQHC